jgi:hypothetical protein
MLKTFIYEESKGKWLEEQRSLFLFDVCAILDDEARKIYVWKGPKITKSKFNHGIARLTEQLNQFDRLKIDLVLLSKKVPDRIQGKLNEMLESIKQEEIFERFHFSRFVTIRGFLIVSILIIILTILSCYNITSSFSKSIINGNYLFSAEQYSNWISFSFSLSIMIAACFAINLIIGIFEAESQVILFSSIGLIINIGISIYLNQGIFLFLFEEGSTASAYLIKQNDVILFNILILSAIITYLIPNTVKLVYFVKTYKTFII